MEAREFALAALKSLGATVTPKDGGLYLVEEDGGREWMRFEEDNDANGRATSYAPGSAAFSRLVSRMIATRRMHRVDDADEDPARPGR